MVVWLTMIFSELGGTAVSGYVYNLIGYNFSSYGVYHVFRTAAFAWSRQTAGWLWCFLYYSLHFVKALGITVSFAFVMITVLEDACPMLRGHKVGIECATFVPTKAVVA